MASQQRFKQVFSEIADDIEHQRLSITHLPFRVGSSNPASGNLWRHFQETLPDSRSHNPEVFTTPVPRKRVRIRFDGCGAIPRLSSFHHQICRCR
ncbi:hypothetical protein TcWFU_004121 [Taenia crassiceps]|uniref:Uncharacterized protein n=1 Tax=Taenia crassiceps TaxID=6207 RepID=A0ABR4Q2X0_9CEST